MLRKQRIIGRVINSIADAGEGEHSYHHPKGLDQTDNQEGACAEQQSADQQHPRAQPVGQEPGRGLQGGGHNIESSEGNADFGIAHAVIRTHERQQRC